MRVFIDRDHNEILLEYVGLSGPPLDPVMAAHWALFLSLYGGWLGGQTAVPKRCEHVNPRTKRNKFSIINNFI